MDRKALRGRVQARFDAMIEELFASENAPQTIDAVEEVALRLRQKAGEIVAQELSQAAAEEAEEKAKDGEDTDRARTCACGRKARWKGERTIGVVTMAGEVALTRSYFYCRLCDAGLCPADTALGLCGTFTVRVQQEVARLGALMAYGPAMRLLSDLCGVSVCPKQAQRLSMEAGERVLLLGEERRQKAMNGEAVELAPPGRAVDVLYLEADGVHTPIVDGWRETKVGLARKIGTDGRPVGPTEYVSHLGNAEAFGEHWYATAISAGLERARKVVVLGDGAAWIWNQASYHFPEAIQILDWFHATEYLWTVARAAFGEGNPETTVWVKATETLLWEGHWDDLRQALCDLACTYPAAKDAVETTLGYYENNRTRMDYPRYRALGLSIGSGAAESGCKQVVTQRLKGAGMRWIEKGAQAIAALRCLILADRWHSFTHSWNNASPPQLALS